MSRNTAHSLVYQQNFCSFACISAEFLLVEGAVIVKHNLCGSMSMEEGQPAAAVRDVGSSEHGDPPLDEKFRCLCERWRVSALQNGALFNCRWNRDALGKQRCGLFSFKRSSVFVRTTAVEHVSFVLS